MKKLSKLVVAVLIGAILMSVFACNAFAAAKNPSVAEMQKSVVLIQSEFKFTASNFKDLAFTRTYSGTGFAIGDPDEPVQYIATCNHCISKDSGVYVVAVNANKEVIDFAPMEEGTAYPDYEEDDGILYCVDYFKVELVDSMVIYSAASGDYTTISVINSDKSSDVAICKLASDPTDKIQARAFEIHDNVEVGTNVYAIGYPFTSDFVNTEGKYDYKDSTVTKGIISKSQLTYGAATQERQFFTYLIDADITNGNSGGPLITEEGYIIGVNSFGVSDSESVATANYAIAIDELIKLMDQSSIPYELAGSKSNVGLIAGIAVGAVVLAAGAAVAVILILRKKKIGVAKKAVANIPGNIPANKPGNIPMPRFTPVNEDNLKTIAIMPNEPTVPVNKMYLVGLSGLYTGEKHPIDGKIVIGRNASKCNLAFHEDQTDISNVHCEIALNGETVILTDLGSTNGTFLADGTKLKANDPVILNGGDKFYLAGQGNMFEIRS